ncbi:siderophore-interacting protein [Kineosporia sp. NBRC 101677]|uniref:RNA polymerase sigma factor n=1 Tax=Kineosporia sp. NBRC 101677 TaxID=3032197 RepID=UPI0024A22D63|nr:RNA polymerase sigma factor [Kineosporia sp. NBRC 101677]GLY13545.1 siderophore-interacting protein [Kineosporia sp. NBRC 101677]
MNGFVGTSADDSFRRLYADNFPAMLSYALRRVGGLDDAADLVADIFLVAWRRRAEMPPGDEARLWLFGVARLTLANHSRGEQRRHQLSERLRLELREHLITHDPTGDLVEVRAVREVMAQLEPVDREVLELAVWEQLAPREIAVALGLSSQVVRARLSRARNRMRLLLENTSGQAFSDHRMARSGHVRGVPTMLEPKEGKA